MALFQGSPEGRDPQHDSNSRKDEQRTRIGAGYVLPKAPPLSGNSATTVENSDIPCFQKKFAGVFLERLHALTSGKNPCPVIRKNYAMNISEPETCTTGRSDDPRFTMPRLCVKRMTCPDLTGHPFGMKI